MSADENSVPSDNQIVELQYTARVAETAEQVAGLEAEAQAALRQYSLERTMGYGIDYSLAVEFRSLVLGGMDWQSAASKLAARSMAAANSLEEKAASTGYPSSASRIAHLRQASALLRLSQAMMLQDTDERRSIFREAAALYAEAADLSGDHEPVLIDTQNGPLSGWFHKPPSEPIGSVIIIGGVEGWSMDFDCMVEAMTARGIATLALDGPGQGESRFAHNHYLTPDWRTAYTQAIDYLETRVPYLPIGFIGNSIGGCFAMAVAADDPRIKACCNNGGPVAPWMIPPGNTFFSKVMAFCNLTSEEATTDVWRTVIPAQEGSNRNYPLLMVHGGEDPMIPTELAQMLFDQAPTTDKQMVIYSDGDHCIYRHKQDRDILISDWLHARLSGHPGTEKLIQ